MFDKIDRDWIYARPQLFIGKDKWDHEALEELVIAAIRQAIDPDTLNQCQVIQVSLQLEDTIIIQDDGRGLPIAAPSNFSHSPIPALIHLLEWYMPTGNPTKEHYNEYGYLGYFARLLNIFSDYLKIETVTNGQVYAVSCSRGEIIEPLSRVKSENLKQGTRIHFKPDAEIFFRPSFNRHSLRIRINELANEFTHMKFIVNID